jgi:hypothetical protein
MPDGAFSYVVSKDCYTSDPVDLTVAYGTDLPLTYKALIPATIWVVDNDDAGYGGYLVRVYGEAGAEFDQRNSGDGGDTPFELDALGLYTFAVEKEGAQSARYPLVDGPLCSPPPSPPDGGAAVEALYRLARVTVHVGDQDGGNQEGYLVRVLLSDGTEWGSVRSDANGDSAFALIEGDYGYQVADKETFGALHDLTVASPLGGPGGVADDQALDYLLARFNLWVSDNAGGSHAGYTAVVYAANGEQVAKQTSAADAPCTFDLVEGDYSYAVEGKKTASQPVVFSLAAGEPGEQAYLLARVVIRVEDEAGTPLPDAKVTLITYPDGAKASPASSDQGETVYYLLEGVYQYQVEYKPDKYASDPLPANGLTVLPPPPGDDQVHVHVVPDPVP